MMKSRQAGCVTREPTRSKKGGTKKKGIFPPLNRGRRKKGATSLYQHERVESARPLAERQ